MESLKSNIVSFLKNHRKQLVFLLFLNGAVLFCITLSSYVHIPLSGFKDSFLYLIHLVLLQFSIVGYIYLSTLNKWWFRLVFIPSFFVLTMFSYWVYTQDISVTRALIHAALETKPSIVMDLLSVQFILFILFISMLLFLINSHYNKTRPIKLNIPFALIALLSFSSFKLIEDRRANTLKSRLPYNVFFGVIDYFEADNYVINKVPNEVYSNTDSLKIVLVLGETVRADHLQLNGYERETTPLLIKETNLVSFNKIFTPHTYTATSLPRIITDAGVNTEKLDRITSVFDVFNASDYYTIWIGNQELEISYESIARTNKKVELIDSLRSVLSFSKALDDKILEPFRDGFLRNNKNGLYTLHMMGSHWWYENRYTEKYRKFKPVIDSKHIPSLSKNELINSYDNTMLYLDNFLNEVIKTQKSWKHPSIMIYISDHGEALGEEGKWLHAQSIDAIKNPAMIVWYSNEFREKYPLKIQALIENSNKNFTTDIIYHSLLDLLDVKNIGYDKTKSVFTDLIKDKNTVL